MSTVFRTAKYSIVLLTLSLILLLIELYFDLDIVERLYQNHATILDRGLPVAALFGIGIAIDGIAFVRRGIRETVYREQKRVYDATMQGMNHLLRNILANLNILSTEEISDVLREKSEQLYNVDILALIEKSTNEVVETIEKLEDLKEMDPDLIRRVAASNADNR